MIRITRLRLKNYRGIKDLDAKIDGKGAIAKGRNGSGKSSVLNAIGAALAANDVGPDAIRIGEKDAEILIDLDVNGRALHAKRRITAAGSKLEVTNEHDEVKKKPTAVLAELLGTAPLDVVSLVLETDKKKRKATILSALPVKVTLPFLRRFVEKLPDDYDVSGHGLEVLARLREGTYNRRTEANKTAAAAQSAAEQARRVASQAEAAAPANAGDVDRVSDELEAAKKHALELGARKDAAARASEQMGKLREQVTRLREAALKEAGLVALCPEAATIDLAEAGVVACSNRVDELGSLLEAARRAKLDAVGHVEDLRAQLKRSTEAKHLQQANTQQADELEQSISDAVSSVSDEEIEAAAARQKKALTELEAATRKQHAKERRCAADIADKAAEVAQAEADRLDGVVKALTTDAPAALLKESGGVAAGLELDGDEVRLGGVSLDHLCGAEKIRFCAEIAKTLSPQAGFLICDGLERLDDEQLAEFAKAATADGRQLFGSLVAKGELQLVAIESESGAAAAE